jgi:hypothetical protein
MMSCALTLQDPGNGKPAVPKGGGQDGKTEGNTAVSLTSGKVPLRTLGRRYLVITGVDITSRKQFTKEAYRKVNIVQILCTHVCKWRNETC